MDGMVISKSPWAKAGLHRASKRDHDPSPSEKGNRRPPRGPGHVQHSLQSAVMSLPIHQGGGSEPFAGYRLLYSADDPTRAGSARNAEHSEDRRRWPLATRPACLVLGIKNQPLCGAGRHVATASASQTTCSTAAKLFLSSSSRRGISKRLPSTSVISSRWSPSHWAFSATFWTTNSRGPRSVCTSQ